VGEGARLTVDSYVYDPNSATGRTARYFFDSLQGLFEYVSGLVAKNGADVQIETPNGTLGPRGTELIGNIGATSATVYLNEGEIAVTPWNTGIPNIYDAQTVVTFNSNGVSTSPFSQDTYNALKNQITGNAGDTQPPTINCASPPS
jgi:hypothetical protein